MIYKIDNPGVVVRQILTEFDQSELKDGLPFNPNICWGSQIPGEYDDETQARFFDYFNRALAVAFSNASYDPFVLWDSLVDNGINPIDLMSLSFASPARSILMSNAAADLDKDKIASYARWNERFNVVLNTSFPYRMCAEFDNAGGQSEPVRLINALIERGDLSAPIILGTLPEKDLNQWLKFKEKNGSGVNAVGQLLKALGNCYATLSECQYIQNSDLQISVKHSLVSVFHAIELSDLAGSSNAAHHFNYLDVVRLMQRVMPDSDERFQFCMRYMRINDERVKTAFIASNLMTPEYVVEIILMLGESIGHDLLEIAVEQFMPHESVEEGLETIKSIDQCLIYHARAPIKGSECLRFAYSTLDHIARYRAQHYLPSPSISIGEAFLSDERAIVSVDVDKDTLEKAYPGCSDEMLEKAAALYSNAIILSAMQHYLLDMVNNTFKGLPLRHSQPLNDCIVRHALNEGTIVASDVITTYSKLKIAMQMGVNRELLETLPVFDEHKVSILYDDLGM